MPDRLYTIGFRGKTAEAFFEALRVTDAARVIDIRSGNTSQLAGFTKRDDLRYFLQVILGIGYLYVPDLAPSQEILRRYREDHDWEAYREGFMQLLSDRKVTQTLDVTVFEPCSVLLCSEADATQCHRSLVAEHLRHAFWPNLQIVHL